MNDVLCDKALDAFLVQEIVLKSYVVVFEFLPVLLDKK